MPVRGPANSLSFAVYCAHAVRSLLLLLLLLLGDMRGVRASAAPNAFLSGSLPSAPSQVRFSVAPCQVLGLGRMEATYAYCGANGAASRPATSDPTLQALHTHSLCRSAFRERPVLQVISHEHASQRGSTVHAPQPSADSIIESSNTVASGGSTMVEDAEVLAVPRLQASHGQQAARRRRRRRRHADRPRRHRSAKPATGQNGLGTSEAAPAAAGALPGLYVQVYNPYTSRILPIPASASPNSFGSVPNISYPDVTNSALFTLAGASINFGLRFAGEPTHVLCKDSGDASERVCKCVNHPWAAFALFMPTSSLVIRRPQGNVVVSAPCMHPAIRIGLLQVLRGC